MIGEGEPRRWAQPELWAKALPSVALQSLFFLAPLIMTVLLTFQETPQLHAAMGLVAEGLDRDFQQAALLDGAVAHAVDVGAVRRAVHPDLAAGRLCAGDPAAGARAGM